MLLAVATLAVVSHLSLLSPSPRTSVAASVSPSADRPANPSNLALVWASSFSAAFLKKNRVAARGAINANEVDTNALVDSKAVLQLGSPNLQLPNYMIPLMIQIIFGTKEVST
ncbi:hypothetical protein EZV62_025114 [Acer yangbiense]|uniref:Uncharacterized protein n=1 Tax=Acer yangbiense TaxID=1000413 RepID=A0A5C7GXJ0_9ROSI|nr:hypothetical protein EZV62_025114 [Acer yangbiense]